MRAHFTRRQVLAAAAAATLAPAGYSHAQQYPSRPIKLVVAGPAGSLGDMMTRLLGKQFEKEFGQAVVVENRVGAGGHIAGAAVAASKADGYTLIYVNTTLFSLAPVLFPNLKYDPNKDLVPVGFSSQAMHWVLTNPSLGIRSFEDFIAYARKNGSAVNYGSGGVGHSMHLFVERIQAAYNLKMTHIPFPGMNQAVISLVANDIQLLVTGTADTIRLVEAGKLQVLATTGPLIEGLAPRNTPHLPELNPQLDYSGWYGLSAPRGVPPEVLHRLNGVLEKISNSPEYVQALKSYGNVPKKGSAEDMRLQLEADVESMSRLVKSINFKAA